LRSLSLFGAPPILWAQPPTKIFRIGILAGLPASPEAARLWEGFVQGLRELGYVEGQSIVIERRYYEGAERLPALAGDLVRLRVDVIVTGGSPAPEMAKRATSTIPIVMATHVDPIGSGLVAGLARPGGNVTGTSLLLAELRGKQLQLLKETLPNLGSVAVLVDPTNPIHKRELTEVEAAARSLQVRIYAVEMRAPGDLAHAFSAVAKDRFGALLIIGGTPLFYNERARFAALGLEQRLPTMSGLSEFAAAGCLMSYGPNLADGFHRAAWYVDRILKGAKPADLSIEQPTKFSLVINLRTAKALGLTIPPAVLARADAVIE
jgi:putative tryptophan/tyrosine transport system substrate-binding protein